MNDKLIVLVGFMGCGKTLAGQELASLLNRPFADLDAEIELGDGRTPAQIINDDGEEVFREKETAALRELLHRDQRAVVALGGGAWTMAVNRELIRSVDSVVAWLDTQLEVCWRRIEQDAQLRPMAPSRPAVQKLFSERLPFYQLADIHVPVADASPKQIAEKIAALLQQGF